MTHADQAALTLLSEVSGAIARIDGPVSSRVGSGVLLAISGVVRERRAPISMRVLEALMGLVVAIRDDITA